MQVTGILRKSMAISTAIKNGYSHPSGSVRVCGLMQRSFGQAASSAINLLRASVLKEGVRL